MLEVARYSDSPLGPCTPACECAEALLKSSWTFIAAGKNHMERRLLRKDK